MTRNTSCQVAHSLCDQAKKEIATGAGLNYHFISQQEHTITNAMGAIVKQLAGREGISNDLRHVFSEARTEFGGSGLGLVDLMRML